MEGADGTPVAKSSVFCDKQEYGFDYRTVAVVKCDHKIGSLIEWRRFRKAWLAGHPERAWPECCVAVIMAFGTSTVFLYAREVQAIESWLAGILASKPIQDRVVIPENCNRSVVKWLLTDANGKGITLPGDTILQADAAEEVTLRGRWGVSQDVPIRLGHAVDAPLNVTILCNEEAVERSS